MAAGVDSLHRTLRVLIVDDEPLAREGLRQLAAAEPGITIAGECSDGLQAVAAIRKKKPDLLLLDIQMPEMDGFDVLRAIPRGTVPAIIFVTAYDAFALKAFEVHAVDYLLKPVDPKRFRRAISRARQRLGRNRRSGPSRRLSSLLKEVSHSGHLRERFVVKSGKRVILVAADAVEWVEASGDYVALHGTGRKHLLRETITAMERSLDPEKFVRIHRSAIVNIAAISEMHPLHHGEHLVLLRDGTQLILSRGYRERAFRRLAGTV